MTNLQSSSDLAKYPTQEKGTTPYGTMLAPQLNIRESNGPKSHENRAQNNLSTNDKKQRISYAGSIGPINKAKIEKQNSHGPQHSRRGHVAGLTVSNANNSAYTRAEKMLSYPPIDSSTASTIVQNGIRDPYSGLNKMFVMPSQNEYEFTGSAERLSSDMSGLNRSA